MKNKIKKGEKTRILSASEPWRWQNISKYFDKDLRQVVLSAKQKRKKNENLTFRSLPYKDRTDTE